MQKEGLTPTDSEYAEWFNDYLTEALEKSGITPDKYHSEALYNAEREKYRSQLISSKGEEYFRTLMCYQVTLDAVMSYANVVEIGA